MSYVSSLGAKRLWSACNPLLARDDYDPSLVTDDYDPSLATDDYDPSLATGDYDDYIGYNKGYVMGKELRHASCYPS